MTAAESQAGQALVEALFQRWREAGVLVCVWKSADRWAEGLNGSTDLDLLAAPENRDMAVNALTEGGWIPVNAEAWRSFTGVFDFIHLQGSVVHHIHLHTGIVSGEKLVKSLRPPLTDLYLNSVVTDYPPFVRPELEIILLVVRIVLKINWIDRLGAVRRRSAPAIYRRYQDEHAHLRPRCTPEGIASLLAGPELSHLPQKDLLTACDDLTQLTWRGRRRIRAAVQPWRHPGPIARRLQIARRQYSKRRDGVGKTLPFPAPSIAVCGPDGSGKTTLSEALAGVLARQLKVRRFYLGGNMNQPGRLRGALMGAALWPYLLVRKACKTIGWQSAVEALEDGWRTCDLRLMRGEKQRRMTNARHAAEAGAIVLYERYPLFFPHGDDLTPSVHGHGQTLPDLLVILQVREEDALARRPEDDPDIIRRKVAAFAEFSNAVGDGSTRVIRPDPLSSVESRVGQVVNALQDLLEQRAQQPYDRANPG